MTDTPPDAPIVLAYFVCSYCQRHLMTLEKPAGEAAGPVTLYVPRTMLVACRACLAQQQADGEARARALRVTCPGSNSVN